MAGQYQYEFDVVIPAGLGSSFPVNHNIAKKCNLAAMVGVNLKDNFLVLAKALTPGGDFHTVWTDDNTLTLVNDDGTACRVTGLVEYRHSMGR